MSFDVKGFGARLKGLRTARGLTQEALACQLNVSWDHLCRLERGNRSCSVDLMIEIAEYFGVSLDYLARGQNIVQVENKRRILSVISELTEIAKNMQ